MSDLEDRIRLALRREAARIDTVPPPWTFAPAEPKARGRRSSSVRWPVRIGFGGVIATVVVAGSLAIAAFAVIALRDRGAPTGAAHRPEAAAQPVLGPPSLGAGSRVPAFIPAPARELAAHLAVMRRTQTISDVLSPQDITSMARTDGISRSAILPALTRYLGTAGPDKLFLVVLGGSPLTLSQFAFDPGDTAAVARLGDAAAIAVVPRDGRPNAYLGRVVFASWLDDGAALVPVPGAVASLVPDAVSRVRWVIRSPLGSTQSHVLIAASVSNNLASAAASSAVRRGIAFGDGFASNVTAFWFDTAGRRIPTTDLPFGQLVQQRQQQRHLRLVLMAEKSRQRVAPAIARAYPLFSSARRFGRFGSGAAAFTVSPVSIPDLPEIFLNIVSEGLPYDPHSAIEVTGPGDARVFVQSGDGFEVTDSLDGGGEASGSLALALQQGIIDTYTARGVRWLVAVVADTNRSVTVIPTGGATRSVPVEDGIAIVPLAGVRAIRFRGANGSSTTDPIGP